MVSEERVKRAQLHPSSAHFWRRIVEVAADIGTDLFM